MTSRTIFMSIQNRKKVKMDQGFYLVLVTRSGAAHHMQLSQSDLRKIILNIGDEGVYRWDYSRHPNITSIGIFKSG